MRFFILLFFIAMLTQCSSNDFVYMCGDHVCLNDKERLAYFKKNMIVEIRDANKNSIKKSPEEKSRIKAAKLEQKKRIKEEKRIKKQAKIAEKIRNKKIRDTEKISKKEKKINIKKVTTNAAANDQQVAKKDNVVFSEKSLTKESNNIDEIFKSITSRSTNKSFPDINDFPK